MEQTATWNREDRDLLVELRTTLQSVQSDIKDLKDGTSKRLDTLEGGHATLARTVERISTYLKITGVILGSLWALFLTSISGIFSNFHF